MFNGPEWQKKDEARRRARWAAGGLRSGLSLLGIAVFVGGGLFRCWVEAWPSNGWAHPGVWFGALLTLGIGYVLALFLLEGLARVLESFDHRREARELMAEYAAWQVESKLRRQEEEEVRKELGPDVGEDAVQHELRRRGERSGA